MGNVTMETTIGELANVLLKGIREEAAKDAVSHTPLCNNAVKTELFNIRYGDLIEIRLRTKINDEVYQSAKEYDFVGFAKKDTTYTVRTPPDFNPLFITNEVVNELWEKVRIELVRSVI